MWSVSSRGPIGANSTSDLGLKSISSTAGRIGLADLDLQNSIHAFRKDSGSYGEGSEVATYSNRGASVGPRLALACTLAGDPRYLGLAPHCFTL